MRCKLQFKNWLINESSLKDLLEPVPQSPDHHEEGNVYIHTRMVRKSLDLAKSLLIKESNKKPFQNINFELNKKEEKMLKICAWLHDIGKASATTIDGNHWEKGGNGKIQAIGHDKPDHYLPMIDKINPIARKMLDNLEKNDLETVYFCIDNHMNLRDGSFSKRMMNAIIETNGNYKNETKVKLLLYLITMDWCGRISGTKGGVQGGISAIEGFKNSAKEYENKNKRVKTSIEDPIEFLKSLKGKPINIIYSAFKNKFNREPTKEELSNI
jgi:F0F1-type ATP synthase gamma subunit